MCVLLCFIIIGRGYSEQDEMVLIESAGSGEPGGPPNVACSAKSILFEYLKLTKLPVKPKIRADRSEHALERGATLHTKKY